MLDFAKCCRIDGRTTVRRVQSGSMSLPDECMVIRLFFVCDSTNSDWVPSARMCYVATSTSIRERFVRLKRRSSTPNSIQSYTTSCHSNSCRK